MSKGSTVLRIAGILLAVFGILNVLWAMGYGFLGARGFSGTGQTTLEGLLMFYGFYGVTGGIFQLAVGSVCIRHAEKEERWPRCFVWGIVLLALGVINLLALMESSGMMPERSAFYPQWYGFAIVSIGGILLPLLTVLSGLLSRPVSSASEG